MQAAFRHPSFIPLTYDHGTIMRIAGSGHWLEHLSFQPVSLICSPAQMRSELGLNLIYIYI